MSAAALVRVGHLFDRLLLVGDPGQLSPVHRRRRALRTLAVRPGRWPPRPALVLRHHPDTPVIPLPVSGASHRTPHRSSRRRSTYAPSSPVSRRGIRALTGTHPRLRSALGAAAALGWALPRAARRARPRTDPGAGRRTLVDAGCTSPVRRAFRGRRIRAARDR